MGKQDVISRTVGPFLDGHHDSRINGVGGGRNHQAEQSRLPAPQSAGCDVRDVSHVIGQLSYTFLRGSGYIRCIPHHFGYGHDRNISRFGYVLQSNHVGFCWLLLTASRPYHNAVLKLTQCLASDLWNYFSDALPADVILSALILAIA